MKNIFSKKGPIANSPDGVMAGLFRKIVIEDKLAPRVENLVASYADRTETTRAGKSKSRNNLLTHINNSKMTFKIFIMLLQKVFKVEKVEISITLFYPKEKVTNHTETLILKEEIKEDE